MTVEGCSRVAKYILVAFNVLVLIAGGLAIGLGVWTYTSDYGGDKLRELTGSGLYRGASIAIIVGGCIIVSLSFLGCCGALMENRVMLGIYFTIMLLFLILFVVAAVLGFVYRDKLKDEISKQMEDTLINDYSSPTSGDTKAAVTSAWDTIQKDFKCCGVEGTLKSTKSWYLWQSSNWFKNQSGLTDITKNFVPASCCSDTDLSKCQKLNPANKQPPKQTVAAVFEENPSMYSMGCVDKMIDEIEKHIGAIAGVAVAVLVVLLLSVIFSVCVCTSIGKDGMVV